MLKIHLCSSGNEFSLTMQYKKQILNYTLYVVLVYVGKNRLNFVPKFLKEHDEYKKAFLVEFNVLNLIKCYTLVLSSFST